MRGRQERGRPLGGWTERNGEAKIRETLLPSHSTFVIMDKIYHNVPTHKLPQLESAAKFVRG